MLHTALQHPLLAVPGAEGGQQVLRRRALPSGGTRGIVSPTPGFVPLPPRGNPWSAGQAEPPFSPSSSVSSQGALGSSC